MTAHSAVTKKTSSGICHPELYPEDDEVQKNLLFDAKDTEKFLNLMQAMDKINQSGLGKVYLGSQRREKEWFMGSPSKKGGIALAALYHQAEGYPGGEIENVTPVSFQKRPPKVAPNRPKQKSTYRKNP